MKKLLSGLTLLGAGLLIPEIVMAAPVAGTAIKIPALDNLGATAIVYIKFGLVIVGMVLVTLASLDAVNQRSEGVGKYLKGLAIAAFGVSAFLFLYDNANAPGAAGATGASATQGAAYSPKW